MKNLIRFSPAGVWIALAICLPGFRMAAGQQSQKSNIPNTVAECETRGKTRLCATWHWNGTEYDASWPDGSVGKLKIRFEGPAPQSHVTFTRIDKTGSYAGLTAVYTGQVQNGKIENGSVQWIYSGIVKHGQWSGTFDDEATGESHPANNATAPQSSSTSSQAPAQESAKDSRQPGSTAALPATPAASGANATTTAGSADIASLNEEISKLDSQVQVLVAQWNDLQEKCPASKDDPGCMDRNRRLALAISQHTHAIAQLIEKKTAHLKQVPPTD